MPWNRCSFWRGIRRLRLVNHICTTDEELRFLWLWCGYCLTGHTREHKFLFLQGPGGGGKTTLMEIFQAVLGGYHTSAPADAFVGHATPHRQWLARLDGARACVIPELPESGRWQLATLKSLVSGDTQIANRMRQDSFEFIPQAKVVMGGNHKPSISRSDSGLARRMVLIPVDAIPEADRDSTMLAKLQGELRQIVRWFVEGAAHT